MPMGQAAIRGSLQPYNKLFIQVPVYTHML